MTIDANTHLLLDFNGGDGSTVFTDTGVNTLAVAAIADAKQSTLQFQFGSGSSYLSDGTGDQLQVANHSSFGFLTNNNNPFTIDMWVYFNSVAANRGFCGQDNGLNHSWGLFWQTTNRLVFNGRKSFQNNSWSIAFTPSLYTWYHILCSRSNVNIRSMAIDGTFGALTTDIKQTQWSSAITSDFLVGYTNVDSKNARMNGHIDEFRFSDVDRYGGIDFTPEIVPYGEEPAPPPPETFMPDKYVILPQIPRRKRLKTNPGFTVTPGMEVPVPIKIDKWAHIYNTPVRVKKRNLANVTQNVLVQFNTPASEIILIDKWFNQSPVPRVKKVVNRNAHVDIDFIDAIQSANGNFFDTGVFGFTITNESEESATFVDSGVFGITITAEHLEDFQLEDSEVTSFKINYQILGHATFNSGVPGFVTANVTINGVNESNMMQGAITVTREDNTAARFQCILELDQSLSPLRKPAELINKIVSISFGAADMAGVVSDFVPIFVGICKHVSFNDDQRSIVMSGYDYGGVHQTKGEFVSDNVTDVLSGSAYANSSGTISLGHSPIWGVIWTGNSQVIDGVDYFINTLNGSIIIPISSRILQFPGTFNYSYQNPFDSMRTIIQTVATLKGWTLKEDNVAIADYTGPAEHPVLSLSDESIIDVCRKFLELSGAKVESNLFPDLRVYSEVQNVINTVNTHTVDESKIFEDSLNFTVDFDNVLNEQTTRSVQKINANVVVGADEVIAEFSGSKQSTDPRTVQTSVVWWSQFDMTISYVVQEHRINKQNLNSISFSSSGLFHAALIPFATFEEEITGASWTYFVDGDDFVIQLKHKIITLSGGGIQYWTIPAFEYSLTVSGSRINYGEGDIADVKIVTAQRPIGGITETLKGDVYENPYIETDQHCANICDAILLENGNPYVVQFEIPLFEGRELNIGDRINIERDSIIRFAGLIKVLTYSINLLSGDNSVLVVAKGVGFGI